MGMQKIKATLQPQRSGGGFSAVELLITATVITIVTVFGLLGITRARATIRLSGAAREYASYLEKARLYSIRRHADSASQRASVSINSERTSYDVTMDLDGDGGVDTRTVTLPEGVTFETVEAIAFDWRGRTWSTVGGVTSANAQVSIRLMNSSESISVDVTGSGDVTIDSRVFDDSVPNVNLHVADLAAGATPTPTPSSTPIPQPSATPGTDPPPTLSPDLSPIPLPDPDVLPLPTPMPTPSESPTPTPTPTPQSTPTPTPTPTLDVCILSTDLESVTVAQESTATIKVSHYGISSVSITGSSSKASDLQVTPGAAQTVAAGGYATFIVKSKRSSGSYTVTFSSNCGQKVVPVVVQ